MMVNKLKDKDKINQTIKNLLTSQNPGKIILETNKTIIIWEIIAKIQTEKWIKTCLKSEWRVTLRNNLTFFIKKFLS